MQAHSPLLIDIPGLALSKMDRRRLAHPLVGGIILFARNWADRGQLTALCGEIKQLRGDLLILVDHEGGRVQRFKTDGFTHLPPMRELGRMWQGGAGTDPQASALLAMRAATACGYVLGAELRACGVDMSFTPVLDLDYGPSGVIGDRAFSPDAAVVSVLAKSLMQGLLQSGMANCGKHFPGHGFVAADSHTDMPLAAGHPAHPAGIWRGRHQRRPEHGRCAANRRQGRQLYPGHGRSAGGWMRHGAAVQPVSGRQSGDRRVDRRPDAGDTCGKLAYLGSQRATPPQPVAAAVRHGLGHSDGAAVVHALA